MTRLTPAQVRHIAALARLKLSDEEVDRFTTELTSILSYVDKLQQVDTKGIPTTAQITGLSTVLREDEVCPLSVTPDALLMTSPLPITDHQIQTPSAHG